jgi:purine-nucleoside phosphorylase
MAYGDFTPENLNTAVFDLFGIYPEEFPRKVVIYPFGIENFLGQNWDKSLNTSQIKEIEIPDRYFSIYKNYEISTEDKRFLILMGGRGASDFADSSTLLCNVSNVEEILFVGNGAGIGNRVRSKDIHIPLTCRRDDQVTNFIVDDKFSANADNAMSAEIAEITRRKIGELDINIYQEMHATIPFFYSETEEYLRKLQELSVLSIDMEMSVIYTIAKINRKKCAGMLRIGDLPLIGEEVWEVTSKRRPELNQQIRSIFLQTIVEWGIK